MPTAHRFEDVTDRSDVEAQQESIPSSRRSARRQDSRRDRRTQTGSMSRSRSRSRSQSRSPRNTPKKEEPSGEITRTLSGLLMSAQEVIGASWAAATAEALVINTSDSGEDYLSATDSPHIAYTGSSPKTGDKESDSGRSTATRKTYGRRRRNSSSSTSVSSLEDYQTPRSSQAQRNPALTQETSALTATSPGRAATPPLSPSPM